MFNQANELGVTNIYISKVLKKTCSNFIGVFSPDTLPTIIPKKGSIVCNLSNSDEIGSHFITIILQNARVLYIDSFGVPCENNDVSSFLSQCQKPVFYNTQMLQDVFSPFCGFYCILFCMYYDRERSFPLNFYSDQKLNDALCIRLIIKMQANLV